MDNQFFEQPILNSPYLYQQRYWELDEHHQPTQKILEKRRPAEFITPILKPRKQKGEMEQRQLIFNEGKTRSWQINHPAYPINQFGELEWN